MAGAALRSAPAEASHFRSNQLSWLATGVDTVEFHSTMAVQGTFFGNPAPVAGDTVLPITVDYGDGSGASSPAHTVLAVDTLNDTIVTEAYFHHTYVGPGPFTAQASACCRLSSPSHLNNADLGVSLSTVVDLASSSASPESSIAPVVDCPLNARCEFVIPALDRDGGTMRFRMATPAEAGNLNFVQPGVPQAPNDASVELETGLYRWDTTGATLNPSGDSYYSTQVIVEDLGTGSTVLTRTAVDFFIRLRSSASNAPVPVLNNPPVVDADVDQTVVVGKPLALDGTVTNAEATDVLVTTWSAQAAPCTFADAGAVDTTVTCTAVGSHELRLTADYGVNLSVYDAVIVRVIPNRPPNVNAGPDLSGTATIDISLNATVSDPDGDVVTTGWSAGTAPCTFANANAIDTLVVCSSAGVYTLTLTGNDAINPDVSDSMTFSVAVRNTPPTVDAGPDLGGYVDEPVSLNGTVTDPDPADVILTLWTEVVQPGYTGMPFCSFADSRVIDTEVACRAPGTFTLMLTASDQVNPAVRDTMILTITIRPPAPPTNQPPSVDAGPDRNGFVNLPIPLDATVSDPEPADVLTVAWSAGGAPCTFVNNSAVDTAVTCSSAGVFVLTLTASDGINPAVSDSVTVTVTKAPKANCKSNSVNHETAAGSSYRSGKRVCRPPHRPGSLDHLGSKLESWLGYRAAS